MAPDLLKLTALDVEDLRIISAHLQDAVMRVGDIRYLPVENRFAVVLNRFDWQSANGAAGSFTRRRTGLRFDRILGVRATNIRQGAPDAVLSLLAIEFEPSDEPSGFITLVFSGGGAIRLEAECIEAAMADLGPVWATASRPAHQTADETSGG